MELVILFGILGVVGLIGGTYTLLSDRKKPIRHSK